MNDGNYEKLFESLVYERDNLIEEKQNLKYKKKIIKLNTLESRMYFAAPITVVSWFVMILSHIIGGCFSGLYWFPMTFGIGIGAIIEKIYFEENKLRKKLKDVSNAKTEYDKQKEMIRCDIDIKKIDSRYRAKKSLNNILFTNSYFETAAIKLAKEDFLKDFSTSENSLEKNITRSLKHKYEKLDIVSSQIVLAKKMAANQKDKMGKIVDGFIDFIFSLVAAMMSSLLFNILAVGGMVSVSIFSLLIPAIIGGVGYGSFVFNKKRNYNKSIQSLNKELGKDAICEVYSGLETTLENKLLMILKDICILEILVDDLKNGLYLEKSEDKSLNKEKQNVDSVNVTNDYTILKLMLQESRDARGEEAIITNDKHKSHIKKRIINNIDIK